MADEALVREALGAIIDPGRGTDLISSAVVRSLTVRDGKVSFVIEVDPARGGAMEPVRKALIMPLTNCSECT